MGYLDDGYAKKGLTWSALPAPMFRAREPGETCTRCGNFHELAPEAHSWSWFTVTTPSRTTRCQVAPKKGEYTRPP